MKTYKLLTGIALTGALFTGMAILVSRRGPKPALTLASGKATWRGNKEMDK